MYISEELEIAVSIHEQASIQKNAAIQRAAAEAREKNLNEQESEKLMKDYEKQV